MKENYSVLPKSVEIHELDDGKFDIILRSNIEEIILEADSDLENQEEYTVYQCDEVQFRYSGKQEITEELINLDFDSWWEYGERWTPTMESDIQPTLEERVSACEESVMALIDMVLDIDDEVEEEGIEE